MALPNAAKDRLVSLSQENQMLKAVNRDQQIIMNDLLETVPDLEEMEKKLINVDKKLEETDYQLHQAHSVLFELLSSTQESNNSQVGAILSSLLKNFQSALLNICNDAAVEGNVAVSVLSIMSFEEEISKIIDTLSTKGLYPEDEEQLKERAELSQQHTSKLIAFLNELKGKSE